MMVALIFIKVILLWVVQIFLAFIGLFLIPFFMPFNKVEKNSKGQDIVVFKCKWFDSIYGNKNDGISGDAGYKAEYGDTFWSRYNWCALRNWTENFTLKLGVDATIIGITYKGKKEVSDDVNKQGWTYSKAIDNKGNIYPMFRFSKLLYGNRGVLFTIGYKNFNINKEDLPKHYSYAMVFSFTPIKEFRS